MRERKPDVINDLWYRNAVLHNCDVRTFMDANGDGVGDFRGLARRLDYLHGLGITAIWLMPFYTSPDRDDGSDVSDYYTVDPRYVIAVHNLADEPAEIRLRVPEDRLVNLFSEAHSEPGPGKPHRIPLEAYGYRWYGAGGLDYLLKRREY